MKLETFEIIEIVVNTLTLAIVAFGYRRRP